jgi:hypothetical protein
MGYRLLADAIVALHGLFVVFVVLGALLTLWRRWMRWLHIPAALWGAFTEFTGRVCPLTPLEQALRLRAGQAGYTGGFIDHYLVPLIYPAGLTIRAQIILGSVVVLLNVALYAAVWPPPGSDRPLSARSTR